ncbi:hypothetical protein ABPG72_006029 [Tetrahymena utriculariae]
MSTTPSTQAQSPSTPAIGSGISTPAADQSKQTTESALNSFKMEMQKVLTKNIKKKKIEVNEQLDRLLNERFQNPFDVLMLDMEATDEEIKNQARQFAVKLHPDRCSDPRAKDAFFIVDKAYKTLCDSEKRKIYTRIMKEAKERTAFEREKENKKRLKSGLSELPEDTFEGMYRENLKKIFDEIEERKIHHAKLQASQIIAKQEEIEAKKMMEQYRVLNEEEWEATRETRVSNWRNFSSKKAVIGSKKSDKSIKPPPTKMEERPASAAKIDPTSGKPIGINEDYKKNWR